MTYIEGIGDEVVISFVILFLAFILLLTWASTAVQTHPSDVHNHSTETVLVAASHTNNCQENELSTSRENDTSTTKNSSEINSVNSSQSNEASTFNLKNEDNSARVKPKGSAKNESDDNNSDNSNVEDSSVNLSPKHSDSQVKISPSIRHKVHVSASAETKNSTLPSEPNEEAGTSSTQSESKSSNGIKIRIKYLDDSQVVAEADLQETLEHFKRRQFSDDLENNRRVKLIFKGRLLRGDQTSLTDHGLFDDCVVHYLNSNASVQNHNNSSGTTEDNQGLDIGNTLLPLLGIILALLWYGRIQYEVHFSGLATFLLLSITVMFSAFLIATYFTSNANQPRDTSRSTSRTSS